MVRPGDTFHDWTVVERLDSARVLARCRCGRTRPVHVKNLRAGRSHRCRHCASIRHGLSGTKIYRAWSHVCRTTALRPSFGTFLRAVGLPPTNEHMLIPGETPVTSLEGYRWLTRSEAALARNSPQPPPRRGRSKRPVCPSRPNESDRAIWRMMKGRGCIRSRDLHELMPGPALKLRILQTSRCLARLRHAGLVRRVRNGHYVAVDSDAPTVHPERFR